MAICECIICYQGAMQETFYVGKSQRAPPRIMQQDCCASQEWHRLPADFSTTECFCKYHRSRYPQLKKHHSTINWPCTGAHHKISVWAVRKLVRRVAHDPKTTRKKTSRKTWQKQVQLPDETICNALQCHGLYHPVRLHYGEKDMLQLI